MVAPPIHYASTEGGVRLAYSTQGTGTPLVWLQELGFSHLSAELAMLEQSFEVVATQHQLIRIDLRNQGLSSRGVQQLDDSDFATDILTVLDRLAISKTSIWALSGRARTAVAFAALHPERVDRLALFGPWLGGDSPPGFTETLTTLYPLAERSWKQYTELVATALVGLQDPEATAAAAKLHFQSVNFDDYRHEIAARNRSDAWDFLSRVEAPTLILQREDEHSFNLESAQRTAELLREGAVRILPPDSSAVPMFSLDYALPPMMAFLAEPETAEPPGPESGIGGGFQTIMFTDLESSTALTQRVGDAAAQEVLHGHNDAVRKSLIDNGGREVKHTGDGIMAAFPSAVRAVEAALQIQRDLAGGEVRVRIGLNAGEPISEDDDFFGTAVQLAARICDRAEPGQVLTSRVVADLCAGKQLSFQPAGEAHMKGFEEPVALFEVSV